MRNQTLNRGTGEREKYDGIDSRATDWDTTMLWPDGSAHLSGIVALMFWPTAAPKEWQTREKLSHPSASATYTMSEHKTRVNF